MSDSSLSFSASASFRNNLMGRNLAPYNVPGSYSPPSGDVNYEATPLNDNSVIDSPNDLIGTTVLANELYPLNEYGPDGGYNNIISTDGPPLPVDSNQGEYGYDDGKIDLVNEFFIDAAYIKNVYGPEGGYKDMLIITDVIQNSQFFLPYADNSGFPLTFNPSSYSPIQILLEDDPQGSSGTLSQDSALAQRAALALKEEFQARIDFETQQLVSSVFQLDQLQDPFEAALVATGQQPLIGKNWKITVPENPALAAVSFANRITGTYFPVSPIPGDYFDETTQVISPQTENALNVANNLTGGLLGPVLNKYRNPSEVFVANTGYGQKSVLFKSLDYNIYRPKYNKGLVLGVTDAISNLLGANTTQGGGYYVGSDQAEPSTINTPANEIPVDRFGKQQPSPVYGPSDLAKLYEGNESKINFGLAGKSYSNQGGITGQFTWVSPKYKDNLGFKVKPGGDPAQQDQEFDAVKNEFSEDTQSTGFEFKGGSILYNTQRLVEAADNVTGARRLQHVGNAINQVSKVFNDGYKEMTKGSQVIAYYDSATGDETISIDGTEVGAEYCRVFQKDTPYFTYADLQKTDGITTAGRRFNYSVLDNTYNLNIAPLRNPGSTNIVDGKVKKYMFSLENLAWRTSSEPGYTYEDLPACEKGPNGGRIMWFPPYNLTFSDSSSASWNPTSFLGRPEPIYTYKNTTRSGQISWSIVVDSPAAMNTIIEKQLANMSPEQVDSIMDSFFAGCVKYDIYDLAIKFSQIKTSDLYTYQEILQNPNSTNEEKTQVASNIQSGQAPSKEGGDTGPTGTDTKNGTVVSSNNSNNTTQENLNYELLKKETEKYAGYAFYFDNDFPIGQPSNATTDSQTFQFWYDKYISVKGTYNSSIVPPKVQVGTGGPTFDKAGINNFFDGVITENFNKIKSEFIDDKLKKILEIEGTKVSIKMIGSASAPATTSYNVNLSKRRVSTVENWFKKQTVVNKTIDEWIKAGRITLTSTAQGETTVIPISTGAASTSINCTQDIIDVEKNKVTSQSQWYSIPAMACRRVAISEIKVTDLPVQKWGCKDEKCQPVKDGPYSSLEDCEANGFCKPAEPFYPYKCTDNGCIKVNDGDASGSYISEEDCNKGCATGKLKKFACVNRKCVDVVSGGEYYTEAECLAAGCSADPPRPTPTPQVRIEQKVKEGITKKVLRSLFSECDYFEVIKETNPTVYASLKDKIKYFNPTFHSMTPEGLNARLTFLNQCVRPGQTIPVIGTDGKPKYNDARNTSFGTPPVLVLRIGDFYHTKIIPNQLSITYEPLLYDINPEGIGVQPMIAKVSLGFDFIGGHGLAGPVAQLQNALSFNFYANTEVYDERSVATESTKDRDENFVAKFVSSNRNGSSNSAPILNQPAGDRGGSTIGTVLTTENFQDGTVQTGTTEFKSIFKELSDKTNGYFTTMFNQIKTMNETSNYPITQLVLLDRKFSEGNLNDNGPDDDKEKVNIVGKSDNSEDNLFKLFNQALKDIDNKDNPIIKEIYESTANWSNATKRDVRNSLYSIVEEKQNETSQAVIGALNTMTKYQEDYVQVFRKLDLVIQQVDGYKLDTGEYKVYGLSEITGDVFTKMKEIYPLDIAKQLTSYDKDLTSNRIIDPETIVDTGQDKNTNFNPMLPTLFDDQYSTRFYMVMSDVFVNKDKYDAFVDKLLTDQVKGNSDLVAFIKETCEELRVQYTKEYDAEKKIFTDFESSQAYTTYKNYKINEFDSKLEYTTDKDGIQNYKDKQKLLKNTYSDLNVDNKRKTFNGKITFN